MTIPALLVPSSDLSSMCPFLRMLNSVAPSKGGFGMPSTGDAQGVLGGHGELCEEGCSQIGLSMTRRAKEFKHVILSVAPIANGYHRLCVLA